MFNKHTAIELNKPSFIFKRFVYIARCSCKLDDMKRGIAASLRHHRCSWVHISRNWRAMLFRLWSSELWQGGGTRYLRLNVWSEDIDSMFLRTVDVRLRYLDTLHCHFPEDHSQNNDRENLKHLTSMYWTRHIPLYEYWCHSRSLRVLVWVQFLKLAKCHRQNNGHIRTIYIQILYLLLSFLHSSYTVLLRSRGFRFSLDLIHYRQDSSDEWSARRKVST
jgi:hypothetical protein